MMNGRSTGTSFEIRGDEQEQHRIQLEYNLKSTELSFHISTDDDEQGQPVRRRPRRHRNSSIEYPRHISEPSLGEYPSFAHRNHSIGDDGHESPPRAWSYRTGDDEEGAISPYGGETMSTVAHHASVVTIGAGLGGGRAARTREPSLSGAEYDPDRPLHALMPGVNNKHSMLNVDPSKSKHQITFDPVVVDSTVELDRLLASGHAPHPPANRSRSVRLTAPPIPSTASSTSDSEGPEGHHHSSRPKLVDHLRLVSFSPKRPRSAQGLSPTTPSGAMPTPRPVKRTTITSTPARPEVRLHPATPSTTSSKFTRMAKGIMRDIEQTQQQIATRQATSLPRPVPLPAPVERNPFHDEPDPPPPPPGRSRMPTPRKSSMKDTTKSRIHLPDVTGLTNAVESPLRYGGHYYPYNTDNKTRDNEARLLQTLNTVQTQLHELEEENAISRRRVHELELELEECKREVARERTRLIEREELKRADVSYRTSSKAKGKSKAKDVSGFGLPELDDERLHERYKEAVDEKKALEALVTSLRSHLTRLTAELSSHQDLLAELRNLREQDARTLREKSVEILQLKEEVQRLAGEVEVLRGVVEDGLRERRASKESIRMEDLDEDVGVPQHLQENRSRVQPHPQDEAEEAGATQDEEEEDDDEDEGEERQDTASFGPINVAADRTMRTDRATLGESTNSNRANVQFVDNDDLGKIAAEVEERRSNRSDASVSYNVPRSPSPVRNMGYNRTVVEDVAEPDATNKPARELEPSIINRPSAPTPGHASGHHHHHHHRQPVHDDKEPADADLETPFPRIRGERLERLFFSAPEHNAKTCTVCHRRRYRPHGTSDWSKPLEPLPARKQQKNAEEYEGGLGEEDHAGPSSEPPASSSNKGKQREQVIFSQDPNYWRGVGRREGLPPQTVVARVIRELEDDFTHYKSVYVELADQYKVMDAVSDVRRRNTLAQHLREVVDILEQKGDQIASLYDLLSFRDKPVSESGFPDRMRHSSWAETAF